jgi:serine/threonine-protein kinase
MEGLLKKKTLNIKLFKLFIILIIILGAFYFSLNMIMSALIHNKKEVIVPNVIGKTLYDAMEELSNSGFGLKKGDEEYNQNIPAGTILRQNPVAGMNVREGKIVKVTVSQGGETVYVPNLVGQTLRSAHISLKRATLVMGEVSRKYSVIKEKGLVLTQDIVSGTAVDKNTVVNLTVSDGVPAGGIVLMPDFINKNIEEAKEWSQQYGITLIVEDKSAEDFEINTIVNQSPAPDSDITKFKKVTLYISR